MNLALGCITPGRVWMSTGHRIRPGQDVTLALNRTRPVRLSGAIPLLFSGGQVVRIAGPGESGAQGAALQFVEYWDQYATTGHREILAFHWTPESVQPGERRYPHLHVGSVMLAERTPVLPDCFNKAHIPTGEVSLAAVVRFGIEELGVRPIRGDWDAVLRDRAGDADL